jgi:DNA modification methylase
MTHDDQTAVPLRTANLAIEHRAIAELRPVGRQARHHNARQMAGIKASIEQFGFISPVLIDAAGKVLAGNARLAAAKALGMTTVPAVVFDHLSDTEKRAFVLAENRLAELGSWNNEVLRLELDELSSLELEFSLEVTGFSLPEIEAIQFAGKGGRADGDDIPAVREETVSKLGDLWMLGDHRLLVGDATSPEALDRLMAGEPARMVFTDPPYNVRVEGHVTGSKVHGEFVQASGEMSDDEFTSFLEGVHRQMARVLADGGLAYVCMDWRHMLNVLLAAKAADLAQINHCIWDKGSPGMGSLYRSQHELVFVLKKGSASHVNNVELGKHGRNRSNVWAYEGVIGFGADKAREREMHPTVKPLALVKDALLDASKKGDIVLDLFGGSGTTLIAAETTGRKARLMELDPRYADVIIRRWEGITGRQAWHEHLGMDFQTLSFGRPEVRPAPARVRVRTAA